MKRALLLSLVVALFALAAHAEEQTLLGNGQTRFGGFGGPFVYYTTFNGQGNVMVGGMGGMTINSLVYLGIQGGGIGYHPKAGDANVDGTIRPTRYEMGYCGGLVGVIIKNDGVVHATADVMIGGGEVMQNAYSRDWESGDDWDDDHYQLAKDGFFAVQPMAHAEVNIVRWMRADLGAGYRFVSGVSQFGLENSDLSGPVAGLSLRFGKF